MAVKLKMGIGVADIHMGIRVRGLHLQFLVEISGVDPQTAEVFLDQLLVKLAVRRRKILR